MQNKTKTGINGFDNLIGGGFPKGSIILLSGSPGTGKTIFGLEYLYNGAINGEKGLYLSFEESESSLIEQAGQFGWDLNKLRKEKKIFLEYIPSKTINNSTIIELMQTIKEKNITRLVIDSVSTLALSIPTIHTKISEITEFSIKRFIHQFIEELRNLTETTIILIGQTNSETNISNDGVSEYSADGIIHIKYESLGGEYSRNLVIRKMRHVKNDEDLHPLEISKKGIIIHKL